MHPSQQKAAAHSIAWFKITDVNGGPPSLKVGMARGIGIHVHLGGLEADLFSWPTSLVPVQVSR